MSEETFMLLFSKNLNKYLDLRQMTQQDLIKALRKEGINVSRSTVSYWCNGIKAPRVDKIDAMCRIFKIKRSDLISDGSSSEISDIRLSLNEQKLVLAYRNADAVIRDVVNKVLDLTDEE